MLLLDYNVSYLHAVVYVCCPFKLARALAWQQAGKVDNDGCKGAGGGGG